MIRGSYNYICPVCGRIFVGLDIEKHATIESMPVFCPHCHAEAVMTLPKGTPESLCRIYYRIVTLAGNASPSKNDTAGNSSEDDTPNLRNLTPTEMEELHDDLEDRSFRMPGEEDGEYCERLRGLVKEIEGIVYHSAKVHIGQKRLRNDADLQQRTAPLLALRRRILDELMFLVSASVREEYTAIEQLNKFAGIMETGDCEIMPQTGLDCRKSFVTDGLYGSDFKLMDIILSVMRPENYRDIYDDTTYAESSIEAFEGLNLCESVHEMHRRLYSLPDLARTKALFVNKTKSTK